MFKFLLSLLFYSATLSHLSANPSSLNGKWIVDSIVIQTTQKEQITSYRSTPKEHVLSYVLQPSSIIISADTINIVYSESSIVHGIYQMDEELLNIQLGEGPLNYRYYRLPSEKLKLEQIVNYWINGEPISELYSIYLHLQP